MRVKQLQSTEEVNQGGLGCREQQETTIVELPRLKTTGTQCMCLEVGSRTRKTKQNRR